MQVIRKGSDGPYIPDFRCKLNGTFQLDKRVVNEMQRVVKICERVAKTSDRLLGILFLFQRLIEVFHKNILLYKQIYSTRLRNIDFILLH